MNGSVKTLLIGKIDVDIKYEDVVTETRKKIAVRRLNRFIRKIKKRIVGRKLRRKIK